MQELRTKSFHPLLALLSSPLLCNMLQSGITSRKNSLHPSHSSFSHSSPCFGRWIYLHLPYLFAFERLQPSSAMCFATIVSSSRHNAEPPVKSRRAHRAAKQTTLSPQQLDAFNIYCYKFRVKLNSSKMPEGVRGERASSSHERNRDLWMRHNQK